MHRRCFYRFLSFFVSFYRFYLFLSCFLFLICFICSPLFCSVFVCFDVHLSVIFYLFLSFYLLLSVFNLLSSVFIDAKDGNAFILVLGGEKVGNKAGGHVITCPPALLPTFSPPNTNMKAFPSLASIKTDESRLKTDNNR